MNMDNRGFRNEVLSVNDTLKTLSKKDNVESFSWLREKIAKEKKQFEKSYFYLSRSRNEENKQKYYAEIDLYDEIIDLIKNKRKEFQKLNK